MLPVAQIKQDVDIVSAIRDSGVELKRYGRLFKAVRPFHGDTDPSFIVYTDSQRFCCFGCHGTGDVIDFVQRYHGLDFKGALNHLGISQGPLSIADRKKIAKANKKRMHRKARAERERELAWTLGTMIRRIEKACRALTPENMHVLGGILSSLEWYRWGHDTLIHGDKLDRAYVLWSFKGFPAIKRNRLFNNNFDFCGWLREFNNRSATNFETKIHPTPFERSG